LSTVVYKTFDNDTLSRYALGMRVTTYINTDNEAKVKALLKKRLWGKVINKLVREMELK